MANFYFGLLAHSSSLFMFLMIDLLLGYLYLDTSQNDLDYWSSSTVAKEGNRQTSPLKN